MFDRESRLSLSVPGDRQVVLVLPPGGTIQCEANAATTKPEPPVVVVDGRSVMHDGRTDIPRGGAQPIRLDVASLPSMSKPNFGRIVDIPRLTADGGPPRRLAGSDSDRDPAVVSVIVLSRVMILVILFGTR